MQYINLTQGKRAIVDDEDYEWLSQWKWCFSKGYAARRKPGARGSLLFMHRVLNQTPTGLDTDHINRVKLDNRRENLRSATRSQNVFNNGKHINNSSGCRGVHQNSLRGDWEAYITINYKRIHLGRFTTFEDAVQARESAEKIVAQLSTRCSRV